ncbi:MAG: 8-amino-7-oxononanoate synthase [Zoogloeaceae bacterium]|nr:8-amino-7-oxononanoate synthase [Zoogloeaceae bacterium]
MSVLEFSLQTRLRALAAQGLTRRRRVLEGRARASARVLDASEKAETQEMLAFASNDYLGLSANEEIARAMAEGAANWGAGSGASHLVSGHLLPHQVLEEALAAHVGFPAALTFSSGYLANLAVTPTLAAQREDAIFSDRLNHASLIDAARLSLARQYRYPHRDMDALARLLQKSPAKTKVIVTDAVFSMDGDVAPLAELFTLAERFDAWLVVDDAHGFGVLGEQGAGSLSHCGLAAHPRLVLMGTLGKAAGVGGAFVAAAKSVIAYLVHKARSYIFTTAQPPALAVAAQKSLFILAGAEGSARRERLRARIQQFREGARMLPWPLMDSQTAIQPLVTGGNEAALLLSEALWRRGLWVPAIRPPAVPAGAARLRVSLSAAHTEEEVARLLFALSALAAEENIAASGFSREKAA